MNIADGLRVPQQWQWLFGSTITGGGIGALVTWFFGIRKTNAEIRKLKTETAKIQQSLDEANHRQLTERLALLLIRRSECLNPNENWMTKAQWAALLKDNANLIDEVLVVLRRDEMLEQNPFGAIRIGPQSVASLRRRG
jgi:hypothetical protein